MNISIPLLLAVSVLPDLDVFFEPFITHRGPIHSAIIALIAFVPFFVIYRQRAVPYFIGLIQHSLIGDYIAGGQVQLLWPLTTQIFGTTLSIKSEVNIVIEWTVFLVAMIVMLKTKDLLTFSEANLSNLILAVPAATVLLPTFVSYPLDVPIVLVPPHLVYLAFFAAAIIIELARHTPWFHKNARATEQKKKED